MRISARPAWPRWVLRAEQRRGHARRGRPVLGLGQRRNDPQRGLSTDGLLQPSSAHLVISTTGDRAAGSAGSPPPGRGPPDRSTSCGCSGMCRTSRWTAAGGVDLDGLAQRRRREAQCRGGQQDRARRLARAQPLGDGVAAVQTTSSSEASTPAACPGSRGGWSSRPWGNGRSGAALTVPIGRRDVAGGTPSRRPRTGGSTARARWGSPGSTRWRSRRRRAPRRAAAASQRRWRG